MMMKLSVMALDMPARDQPVSVAIGSRNTASENIAPIGDTGHERAQRRRSPNDRKVPCA